MQAVMTTVRVSESSGCDAWCALANDHLVNDVKLRQRQEGSRYDREDWFAGLAAPRNQCSACEAKLDNS